MSREKSPIKPVFCRYQSQEDFWRLREFLRRLFLVNDRRERSWHVARLDYARWHTCLNCGHVGLKEVAFLWETEGQIVGLVMPDGGRGEAHFGIDPEYDTPELEAEMLDVAEQYLAADKEDGKRNLYVWAHEHAKVRQRLLVQRGYRKDNWPEHQWRRSLDLAVPEAPLPPGYVIRSQGDGLELLERCYASGLAFHEGDLRIALDNRNDPGWYYNIQRAPLYRRDLDLVAVAPDGAVAAFCTIWFDDVTRSAYFEPVGTVPAHRRRGLARALLCEGLHRLRRMGATLALVGGYSASANALYESVMGPDCELDEPWVKEW